MKKAFAWFSSMRLALVLLGLILLVCILGGIIPQNALSAKYTGLYGDTLGMLVQILLLHQVFTAWWFMLLVGLLLLNLCLCSLTRFPQVFRQYREGFSLNTRLDKERHLFSYSLSLTEGQDFVRKMRFPALQPADSTTAGAGWYYAVRHRSGVWGSWLSHLGMLVIVVGFALGQLLHFEAVVYGVPGQRLPVEGTKLEVSIESFDIRFRPDHTVEQYEAGLTVYNMDTNQQVSGTARVNEPLQAFGKSFLQNATGWAATLTTYQGEERLDERILFAGESLGLQSLKPDLTDLTLVFHALYPDYVRGSRGPATRSPYLNNPAALFSLYYQGKLVDMNMAGIGHDIKAADTRFVLSDPVPYTLLQVVSDPTLPVVALGGVLMLLGLFLAFYLRPEELWAEVQDQTCTVYGYTKKGAAMFADKASIVYQEVITKP